MEKIKTAVSPDARRHREAEVMRKFAGELQEIWDRALVGATSASESGELRVESEELSEGEGERIDTTSVSTGLAMTGKDEAESGTKASERDSFEEDKYFERQVDQWESKADGTRIKVGELREGSALHQVGFPAEGMWFDVGKIKKSFGKHGDHLTKTILKKIPELLNDPIAITEYRGTDGTINNTVNVFGLLLPDGNTPVVVGVVMTKASNGVTVINKIRTIHAHGNANINDDNILYLNEDKKKTRSWFQVCGNSVPLNGTRYGLIRSIAYTDGNVKQKNSERDSEGTELSAKYGEINLNQNISDMDGVPAIELNDGSILPIQNNPRTGKRDTHVQFIENNRIDFTDIRSGGWIEKGVYEPSYRSDTERYVERQRARQRTAEKRGEEFNQFRYSERDITEGDTAEETAGREKSYAQLRAEIRRLRGQVEYWKGQTKITKEASINEKDVAKLARRLVKDFETTADTESIRQQLTDLGNYLVRGDENGEVSRLHSETPTKKFSDYCKMQRSMIR